jgi:serpin B
MIMNTRNAIAWALLLLTAGCVASAVDTHLPKPKADVSQVPATDVEAVANGNAAFAVDLHRRLSSRSGNIVVSPHSISTALAMTYAGAPPESQTAQQMASTLHFTLPAQRLHPAFAASLVKLHDSLQPDGETKLSIANSLWGQRGYAFHEPFIQLLLGHYDAPLTEVNFADPAAAAKAINDWVSRATAQKIKQLIEPSMVDDLTRLVLVNAVYFNGKWQTPFEPKATRDQPFFIGPENQVSVPLMHQELQAGYFDNDLLQAVELGYKDSQLAMIVLVPREVDGVAAVEQSLTASRLRELSQQLQRREVHLWLPRFKFETRFELSEDLKAMGMPDAFDPELADFTGMSYRDDMHIAFVIHKAVIEVNERGTEAAAATGVGMRVTSAPADPPPQVRIDRPFLFVIRDRASGAILFMGRVSDPRS